MYFFEVAELAIFPWFFTHRMCFFGEWEFLIIFLLFNHLSEDAEKLRLYAFSDYGDVDSLEKMVDGSDFEDPSHGSSNAPWFVHTGHARLDWCRKEFWICCLTKMLFWREIYRLGSVTFENDWIMENFLGGPAQFCHRLSCLLMSCNMYLLQFV